MRTRHLALAFAAATTLGLTLEAVAQDALLTEVEIRRITDVKAMRFGFDPETFDVTLLRDLRPIDETFLEERRIARSASIRGVYYDPRKVSTGHEFHGDFTIYIDPKTGSIIASWFDECQPSA